ncbi:MAG: hypothetical protein GY720_04365 [bacterium]|nr:hypothetical protein [bacterium]
MPLSIPRLVLHAGIHKTGTTTLQVSLKQLRPQLHQRGVALVTIEMMKKLPHEGSWAARRTRNPVEAPLFQDELRNLVATEMAEVEQVSGAPTQQVLISNERLVGARMPSEGDSPRFRPVAEDSITEVIEALAPERTHLALYTRRQDRLMESCYLWEIQKGRSHSVRDQFPYIDQTVLRYFDLARRLRAIPKVDSMRVRPFELIGAGSLLYLEDFLVNIGLNGQLDMSEFEEDPSANRSYSNKALSIALKVNRELETKKERDAVKRFLKRAFPIGTYPGAQILTPEERTKLIERYADDNEQLFLTFMPDLPMDSYSSIEATKKLGTVLNRG